MQVLKIFDGILENLSGILTMVKGQSTILIRKCPLELFVFDSNNNIQ